MTTADEQWNTLREVIGVLASLGIRYAVGGSIASSVHGVPRFTRDADLTVEPFAGREQEFAAQFGPEYYLSTEAMRQAHTRRGTFNIIQCETGFKVDCFVQKDRPFDASCFERSSPAKLPFSGGALVQVLAAEDIALLKLEWYRLTDEISDRQWDDVLGILRAQTNRLDLSYLHHWSSELGVQDLLEEALLEAGVHKEGGDA